MADKETKLTPLLLEPNTRCGFCGELILWGEPYEASYPSELCSGCAMRPLFRNGGTSTEAACAQLRRENIQLKATLSQLEAVQEDVEALQESLASLSVKDLMPAGLKTAMARLLRSLERFEKERPRDAI